MRRELPGLRYSSLFTAVPVPFAGTRGRNSVTHYCSFEAHFPPGSDVYLLRYRESVIDLNTEISDRTLYPGMPEQELDGAKIACATVNERRLRPSKRMGAKETWILPNRGDPFRD